MKDELYLHPLPAAAHYFTKSDMEEKVHKEDYNKPKPRPKAQNGFQTIVVREFEPADKLQVQQIFSEGLMEMIPDTALRGLRHHPESVLLYSIMTGKITA